VKHWEDTALSCKKETWCGIRLWRLTKDEYTRDMNAVDCPECMGVRPLWDQALAAGRVNEDGVVYLL
jgi:hypothetical protein